MRLTVLGVATAVTVAVSAHVAAAQDFPSDMPTLAGYLEGFGGWSTYRLDERQLSGATAATERSRGPTFGGAARAAFQIAPDWRAQADAWVQHDNFSGTYCAPPGSCGSTAHFQQVWGVAGHISRRMVGTPLLGGLVSFGGSSNTAGGNTSFVNVAGEAQKYLGPFTFYGQLGYVHSVAGDLSGQHPRAWYLQTEVRVYKTQNLMFAGNLGYAQYNIDDTVVPVAVSLTGRHSDIVRWGARVEYKFDHAPVSLFAAYEGGFVQAPYIRNGTYLNDTIHDATLIGGIHYFLQTTTLQGNERSGAGLIDWNPIFGNGVVLY